MANLITFIPPLAVAFIVFLAWYAYHHPKSFDARAGHIKNILFLFACVVISYEFGQFEAILELITTNDNPEIQIPTSHIIDISSQLMTRIQYTGLAYLLSLIYIIILENIHKILH